MRLTMSLIAILVVSACSGGGPIFRSNKIPFEGVYYRANLSSERSDRASFTTTVHRVSDGLSGALEAARYEGTKHCIQYFGSSAIEWQGPGPDTPPEELTVVNDQLTFAGRCLG